MDDMQTQMNAILSNPEMMQKIMTMAQSLNQSSPQQPEAPSTPSEPERSPMPAIDPGMLQKLAGLSGQSSIDKNQRSLLTALSPYLSKDKISRLERAMRAAKMANLASAFLGNSGFIFNPGR